MNDPRLIGVFAVALVVASSTPAPGGNAPPSGSAKPANAAVLQPRSPDGDGSVKVSGEARQWHKITVDLAGPFAREDDNSPNPFTDYRYHVMFVHESGAPVYMVPGYFAADGDAANSSADSGRVWRAHFAPELTGKWTYRIMFAKGGLGGRRACER